MLLTMSLNCRRWLITLLRCVNWQRRCYKRIIMHPKILKLRRNSWTEAVAVLPCVWTEGETSFWRHWGFIRVPERYGIMIACDVFFLKWQRIHAIRLESTVFSQYHWQLLKWFRHLKCMLWDLWRWEPNVSVILKHIAGSEEEVINLFNISFNIEIF